MDSTDEFDGSLKCGWCIGRSGAAGHAIAGGRRVRFPTGWPSGWNCVQNQIIDQTRASQQEVASFIITGDRTTSQGVAGQLLGLFLGTGFLSAANFRTSPIPRALVGGGHEAKRRCGAESEELPRRHRALVERAWKPPAGCSRELRFGKTVRGGRLNAAWPAFCLSPPFPYQPITLTKIRQFLPV